MVTVSTRKATWMLCRRPIASCRWDGVAEQTAATGKRVWSEAQVQVHVCRGVVNVGGLAIEYCLVDEEEVVQRSNERVTVR
jgi:hypothetical protein